MEQLHYILAAMFVLLTTAFLRLFYVLPAFHRTRPLPRKRGTPTHLLIVLGSGGHTAEMLSMLTDIDPVQYTHRSYVVSSGDDFSVTKAEEFESSLAAKLAKTKLQTSSYTTHTVPRARRIHQSLLTAPFSSIRCLFACLTLLRTHQRGFPDLILVNGPATSLILVLASTILHYYAVPLRRGLGSPIQGPQSSRNTRSLFIESWARVKRPSLSGRIIVWCGLCDRVLVQWKGLEMRRWGEFKGALVQ